MRIQTRLRQNWKLCHSLLENNRNQISALNYSLLIRLARISSIIMLIIGAIFGGLFRHYSSLPAYFLCTMLSFLVTGCKNRTFVKKNPLVILYFLMGIYFLATIYTTVIMTPQVRATVSIALFCITPILIIDEPWRLDLFVVCFYILHTAADFAFKPVNIALTDAVNCLCSALVGIYTGNITLLSRLSEKELLRHCEEDKVTDVLTGVGNRRRFFERLAILETTESQKPAAALMIDIDGFKTYNDSLGHAAGDQCLRLLGSLMLNIEKASHFPVAFYRYGGDEFAVFVYGCSRIEADEFAVSLQKSASGIAVSGQNLTISIGLSYAGGQLIANYEKLIESADQQLYRAKALGHSQLCSAEYE